MAILLQTEIFESSHKYNAILTILFKLYTSISKFSRNKNISHASLTDLALRTVVDRQTSAETKYQRIYVKTLYYYLISQGYVQEPLLPRTYIPKIIFTQDLNRTIDVSP